MLAKQLHYNMSLIVYFVPSIVWAVVTRSSLQVAYQNDFKLRPLLIQGVYFYRTTSYINKFSVLKRLKNTSNVLIKIEIND